MNKLFVINRLDLGSRELGWELWNGTEVVELSTLQVKAIIKAGDKICGLKIDDDGNLDLDREGFFTTNMMKHSHINHYTPMIIDRNHMANFFVVVDKFEYEGKVVYTTISSRFARENHYEERIMMMLQMGMVTGGIKIDEFGKLVMPAI